MINSITVDKIPGFDPEFFKGKHLSRDHARFFVNDSTVVKNSNGATIAVFVKGGIDKSLLKAAWMAIEDWNPKTANRGNASGMKVVKLRKLDGTISRTNRTPKGEEVVSGIAGYYDRYPRIPYCRKCDWNLKEPAKYKHIEKLAAAVSAVHQEHDEPSWQFLKQQYEKTNPDFRMPETVYTTITVNKNFRTACHLDGRNLAGAKSAMVYLQRGKLVGGELILPEYGVGFKLEHGDVIIFDGQEDWHGNAPYTLLTRDAVRCTLVHYFRNGMLACGSAEEELERAKNLHKILLTEEIL